MAGREHWGLLETMGWKQKELCAVWIIQGLHTVIPAQKNPFEWAAANQGSDSIIAKPLRGHGVGFPRKDSHNLFMRNQTKRMHKNEIAPVEASYLLHASYRRRLGDQ